MPRSSKEVRRFFKLEIFSSRQMPFRVQRDCNYADCHHYLQPSHGRLLMHAGYIDDLERDCVLKRLERFKYGCKDMATEVDDMRRILISACLAIIVLAACLASAALSSPNLDMSAQSALAKAGSFASSSVSSFATSINVEAIDTGKAASGNSKPVNLTVSVTQSFSDSNQRCRGHLWT